MVFKGLGFRVYGGSETSMIFMSIQRLRLFQVDVVQMAPQTHTATRHPYARFKATTQPHTLHHTIHPKKYQNPRTQVQFGHPNFVLNPHLELSNATIQSLTASHHQTLTVQSLIPESPILKPNSPISETKAKIPNPKP